MRLTGTRLIEFKQQAQTLRDQGYSYPAIGYLLGKDHTTVLYHLNEDRGARRREQMRFYNYMKATEGEYDAVR